MYVLLMLIGVSAVVYQMLMHERKRKHVRSILTNLGAKRIQLMAFLLVENIVIVTLAAIAGLFLFNIYREDSMYYKLVMLKVYSLY